MKEQTSEILDPKTSCLNREIEKVKSKEKVSCNDCEKSFRSAQALDRHRKKIHKHFNGKHFETIFIDGAKRYKCDLCEKSFTTTTVLKRHINGIHNEARNFACSLCDKKFKARVYIKHFHKFRLRKQ